jgi:hypothetical protein
MLIEIARHEGLAPVRLSLRLETGSGFYERAQCLGVASDRSSALSPVLGSSPEVGFPPSSPANRATA